MNLTPLTLWALFFVAGIAAGRGAGGIFWVLFAAAFFCLGVGWVLVTRRRLSRCALFAAAFFLGALHIASFQIVSVDHVSRFISSEKKKVVLVGVIASVPRVLKNQTTFLLKVDRLRGYLWARCFAPGDFFRGDRWLLEGVLSRPSGALGRAMEAQGASAILSVPKSGRLRRFSRERAFFSKITPEAMARKVGVLFSRYMEPLPAGLYRAMILGEKRSVPKEIKQMMIRTGTWHIMVVSGSHTAFLAGILLVVFKIFCVPRRVRFILTFLLLVFYCFMTGASSPVARATVMTTIFLLSFIIERNPVLFHSLALSALVILLFDPGQLFDAGFQLSFLSVLSIVFISPRLMPHGLLKKISHWSLLAKYPVFFLVHCFVVSLSAWAGTAPLLFLIFGTFSPVAVLANTAVAPIAILVTASGFAFVPVALTIPPAAPFFGQAASFFMELLLKVNSLFS
jgi:competence protein ComEC